MPGVPRESWPYLEKIKLWLDKLIFLFGSRPRKRFLYLLLFVFSPSLRLRFSFSLRFVSPGPGLFRIFSLIKASSFFPAWNRTSHFPTKIRLQNFFLNLFLRLKKKSVTLIFEDVCEPIIYIYYFLV